jgi:hypothetical protein
MHDPHECRERRKNVMEAYMDELKRGRENLSLKMKLNTHKEMERERER